jgi:mono/diheme cytochrome c family protein
MKIALLASSLASLVILGASAYHENFRGEWREHQRLYKSLLEGTAKEDNASRAARAFAVEHRQLYLPELGRIDRCTTCHLGVENPEMARAAAPLGRHPGTLLESHPADRFGCTVCHEGNGRVVTREAAHGWTEEGKHYPHAEAPLLKGLAVFTSCGKCHQESDLYGGHEDLYAGARAAGTERAPPPIDAGSLVGSLPGADELARGKDLLVRSGCLGCHKYRGRGGTLGPDITYVGEKKKHDFDFRNVQGEHTVENWLKEHFLRPAEVSPGTLMPSLGTTEAQATDLARLMMSFRRKAAPASHLPAPPVHGTTQPVRGETLYAMFCSACHGEDGHGTTLRQGLWPQDADPWGHEWDARNVVIDRRGDFQVFVPSLHHEDTLAVASDEYLTRVIASGRPGTKMLGWMDEGGLAEDEVTLLVDFIRAWAPRPPEPSEIASLAGDPRVGGALYRSNCASCHGRSGEGGLGNTLSSPTFLAVASDAFLRDTIVNGRPNTAMPAWRSFTAQEVSDLLAFLRSWQPRRAQPERTLELAAGEERPEATAAIGRILYKANCIMCHGEQGEGDLGPSLRTREFLTAVPNEYLVTTLLEGRPGTAMPSWRHLTSEDVAALVRHLRTWQVEPSKPAEWHLEPVVGGDADAGRLLFTATCSGCHGEDGEGASGPQLNNPMFLRVASDRMLEEWISRGKTGTEMRAFRKGGQGVAELSERQIQDLVAHLRSLERVPEGEIRRVAKSPHGRPERGAETFAFHCTGCHGPRGEGASGPALSNRGFLAAAGDGFLLATLALGRSGTEMNDVVAYLRSWEHAPPFGVGVRRQAPHRFVIPWNLARGRALFTANCEGCHGPDGKGAWAPQLNNEGFLAAATDGFLQATIVRGRKGTAMRPFGHGSQGLVDFTPDDVDDIVAYMRSWSRTTPSPMTLPAETSLSQAQVSRAPEAPQGD